MMKIVVVGGGVISKKLLLSKYAPKQHAQFSIRDLQRSQEGWPKMQLACVNADAIIFLAYHHRSIYTNIKLLLNVLVSLRRHKWQGIFIFLNTQTTLVPQILESPKPLPGLLTFDQYTVTKKIQSSILSYFASNLNIFEIFLPVITGSDSKAHNRFLEIALHPRAFIPNAANNYFAQLDINIMIDWIWTCVLGPNSIRIAKSNGQVLRIFIYQNLRTFRSYLSEIRKTILDSEQEIACLSLRYRFSNNFIKNLVWYIKMSPIGLFLYIVRYAFMITPKKSCEVKDEQVNKSMPQVFVPSGSEYQFLGSTINLSSVPFEVLKIG